MLRWVNEETTTKFGEWLNSQMNINHYNCTTTAKALHSTKQTISNHIRGKVQPSYVWVVAYCRLFKDRDNPDEIWKISEEI